jgi:hypothetical protein
MIDPYKPACSIDIGTDMKAIPTYILVRFAAVKNQEEPLFFLVSGVRCFSAENLESVNFGHPSDGLSNG